MNDQVDTLSNNSYIPDNEEIIDFNIDIQFSKRILHTDQNKIITMIHELYNNNNNFYDLIVHNDYTNLFVTKPIHNDRIAKFKHFTAYFYSNIQK